MYNLGFPTDAIDAVKKFYEDATKQIRLPSEDTLRLHPLKEELSKVTHSFSFLFLLYMEPLLQWLHVGGRGSKHSCTQDQSPMDTHLAYIIISASFADDLTSETNIIQDKVQAWRLKLYSDRAALVLSGSKTKIIVALYSHPSEDTNSGTPHQTLQQQLKRKIYNQNQKAQSMPSDAPFLYLGFSSPWISTGKTRSSI